MAHPTTQPTHPITNEFIKLITLGISPENITVICQQPTPDTLPKEFIYIKFGGIESVWKIGKTVDIERRRKDYQCGLAAPITFEYVFRVYNCTHAENLVKRTLEFCKYNNIKQNELYSTDIAVLSQLVLDACILSNKVNVYSQSQPMPAAAVNIHTAASPITNNHTPTHVTASPITNNHAASVHIPNHTIHTPTQAAAPAEPAKHQPAAAEPAPKSSPLSFLASAFTMFGSSQVVAQIIAPTLVWVDVDNLRKRTPKLNTFQDWQALPTSIYIGSVMKYVAGTHNSEWRNVCRLSTANASASQAQLLENYKNHIRSTPALMAAISTLTGKELGCFCRDSTHCHGLVLIELWYEQNNKTNKK